jgi:hypothetical protein
MILLRYHYISSYLQSHPEIIEAISVPPPPFMSDKLRTFAIQVM